MHPFDVLRAVTMHFHLPYQEVLPPLACGLMGYLAYDLKDRLENLPKTSVDDLHLPDMLLYAPKALVIHDKLTHMTRLMVPQRSQGGEQPETIIREFHQLAEAPVQDAFDFSTDSSRLKSNFSQGAYQEAVQQVIDFITAGDVYQVNLSQRFRVPFKGNGFALFRHLFTQNPAPFFAFIQAGNHQVVSTSPERFISLNDDQVETRPIKGTRPRGVTAEADHAMHQELINSPKDSAELAMIVDLLRNDIGKVCSPGSVQVVAHKRLETYQNVHHLVSIVAGKLDKNRNAIDLIEATFPGGSITGCPKVRAMEIIDALESYRRHVYCGSIGYISFHDTLDLSIAIRTATLIDDTMVFSVGGGIVFDSNPQQEYEETLHKGQTLMAACQQGETTDDFKPIVWQNGRLCCHAEAVVPIVDQGVTYGFGFFETLRVDCGYAPLLDDHLARLGHTWLALMPGPLPDLTWKDVIAQVVEANGLQNHCAAVKIMVTRGCRTRAPWDHGLFVSARPYLHRLKMIGAEGLSLGIYPHPRQSPLAAYKTLNYLYYLKAGQWAADNGFNEAVILNPDGTVSETNTANLLLIHGREVIRPESVAALPGVMTQAVCRQLKIWNYRIIDQKVQPEALYAAEQILVTNALMGVVPISHVNNTPCAINNELWIQLNDQIIPQWRC